MANLDEINTAGEERATALLTPMIERAPQIAKRVVRRRPFQHPCDLSQAIRDELVALREAERLELFRAHPELAPPDPHLMTSESQAEQGRLDLTTANGTTQARLRAMNDEYAERFGFPFIVALVRHHSMDSVLAEFEARLTADRATEIETAIEQVAAVSASRVAAAFGARNDISSDRCLETEPKNS